MSKQARKTTPVRYIVALLSEGTMYPIYYYKSDAWFQRRMEDMSKHSSHTGVYVYHVPTVAWYRVNLHGKGDWSMVKVTSTEWPLAT